MPLPKRRPDEDKDEFIDRCMGDDTMVKDFPDPAQRRAVCEGQSEPKEESSMNKYPRLVQAVFSSPWAILEETLEMIVEIVQFRAAGGTLSAEEIQDRIGAVRRPVDRLSRPVARQAGAIAVLPLRGPIAQRMNLMTQVSGGTSTEVFSQRLAMVMNEPSIKAVVIDVDSPGGTVFGVDELASELFHFRGTKPIIAQVNSMMASAAFWIGAAADEVVITPGGLMGSVGVFLPHTDTSQRDEKEGVKTTLISAGRFKTEGASHEPLGDEARESLQGIVDSVFDRMVKSIARSRDVSAATVRNGFGEGRVVTSAKAVELGMADRVSTLKETLESLGADRASTRVLLAMDEAEEVTASATDESIDVDANDAPPDAGASTDLRRRRLRLVERER